MERLMCRVVLLLAALPFAVAELIAQSAPTEREVAGFKGLHAAAHLGRVDVVKRLIAAGAPLDHVNNLGWTALIEAVVLGDGGPDHTATVATLVHAGADATLADRQGVTPLQHAQRQGYTDMVVLLEASH